MADQNSIQALAEVLAVRKAAESGIRSIEFDYHCTSRGVARNGQPTGSVSAGRIGIDSGKHYQTIEERDLRTQQSTTRVEHLVYDGQLLKARENLGPLKTVCTTRNRNELFWVVPPPEMVLFCNSLLHPAELMDRLAKGALAIESFEPGATADGHLTYEFRLRYNPPYQGTYEIIFDMSRGAWPLLSRVLSADGTVACEVVDVVISEFKESGIAHYYPTAFRQVLSAGCPRQTETIFSIDISQINQPIEGHRFSLTPALDEVVVNSDLHH